MTDTGKNFKIGCGALIAAIIVTIGVYAFFQLKSEKESYEADLFSLVPTNTFALIQIHDTNKLITGESLFSVLSNLLPEQQTLKLCGSLGNDVLLSYHPEGALIYAKLPSNDFNYLKNTIFKRIFSYLSPETMTYKDTKIYLHPAANNDFFCYTHHKGVFIGSYSKNLLDKAIDMYGNPKSLRNDSLFNAYAGVAGKNALANLFITENNTNTQTCILPFKDWFAGDIEVAGSMLMINGVILKERPDNVFRKFITENKGNDSLNIKSISPQTAAYIYLHTDSVLLGKFSPDTLLSAAVDAVIGLNYMAPADSSGYGYQVTSVKIKDSGFSDFVYKQSGKSAYRMSYPRYFNKSECLELDSMLKNLLEVECPPVFTWYKGYILTGQQEEHIEQYITQSADTTVLKEMSFSSVYDKNSSVYLYINGKKASIMPDIYTYFVPSFFNPENKRMDEYNMLLQLHKSKGKVYFNWVLAKAM